MKATRVFVHGKIYTVNEKQAWAQAVALDGNTIVYVGDDEGASAYIGDDTVVTDLQGKLMLPGLIEGHCHPFMAADFQTGIVLNACESQEEILQTIADYVRDHPDNDCYSGQGWNEIYFDQMGPNRQMLDAICADKPIYLASASCHGSWCNTLALKYAHVDKNTPDPLPGSSYFTRDENGDPTGYMHELTSAVVQMAYPYLKPEGFLGSFQHLAGEYASSGFTTWVDCGVSSVMRETVMDENFVGYLQKECPLRTVGGMVLNVGSNVPSMLEELKEMREKYSGGRLSYTFFKAINDGVCESGTAAMAQPYPGKTELVPANFTLEHLVDTCREAAKAGFDVNIHGIGSAASHMIIDMAEQLRKEGFNDTRIAISHYQCNVQGDAERAAEYQVYVSTTPVWFKDKNFDFYEHMFSGPEPVMYPVKTVMEHGGKVGFGSDYPTDPSGFSAFKNMEVGQTRMPLGSGEVATDLENAAQLLTLEELIAGYTINNAWQIRQEDTLGSIEVGKLADLVIMEDNLFEMPTEQIHTARVHETIMDGVTTFKRK